ncbi:MAG: NAD(P)H-dependent oxidoreductase [Methanomassiliicoccaceae archaeon]|jgi:multimeric flavodoxin WrbA|nr:NAD(P)H-dependent oxidoreductase [Methanomassiliicoccaceae archaeon]
MKVTIFNGSASKGDATHKMTSSVAEMLKAGGSDVTEHFICFTTFKGMGCCNSLPDEVLMKMIDDIESSDISILATPVYRWNISGVLCAFIEALLSFCKFNDDIAERMKGKKVALAMAEDCENNIVKDAIRMVHRMCDYMKLECTEVFTIPFADKEKIMDPACQDSISEFVKKIIK